MKKLNLFFIVLFFVTLKLNECSEYTNDYKIPFGYNIEYSQASKKAFQTVEEEYDEISLNKEMDREEYKIVKSAYKFKNENPKLIFIVESYSDNLIIQNENSKGFKNINIIKFDGYLTVNKTGDIDEHISVTSIPNSNVYIELLFDNNYDNLYLKQKFTNIKIIETKEDDLISVFGSFDENNEVYYIKYSKDTMNPKDIYPINKNKFIKININDKIVNLDKQSTYIIINEVFDYYLSSLEFFITQKYNKNEEIILYNNNEKYLYLNKDKTYNINLNNILNLRAIKLSRKTINSKITINNNFILNKENKYYDLHKNENLNLIISNEDALIEFLYYFENEEIFDQPVNHRLLTTNSVINYFLIKLNKRYEYIIKLESDLQKSFGTSIYGTFGKGNYHYFSDECNSTFTFGFSYEDIIKIDKFDNIVLEDSENYIINLNVYKPIISQPLYLTYYPIDIINFGQKEEFDKKEYQLEEKHSRFINNNPELIYIFESYFDDLIIRNEDNKGLKNINILEYGSFLTVEKKVDSAQNIIITSIPNSNVYIESLYLNNYDKLYLKQKFTNIKIIETGENNLISTFNSFDENSKVYYTKYTKESMSLKDIYPINEAKFEKVDIKEEIIKLEKNSIFIIINKVSDYYLSSLEFFITQEQNNNQEIKLKKNNEKYLYLNKDNTYKINLNAISNSRAIKLSSKTINAKITINNNIILDKENMFYELNKNTELSLKIENDDALIEILYYFGDEKVFSELEIYKQKINEVSRTHQILIKLSSPYDYVIKLESDLNKSFGTSIYGKFGKGNYHYYSSECNSALIFGFTFEELIKSDKFKNIKLKNDEYYMISLYILKGENSVDQPIYLSYYPLNQINFKSTTLNSAIFSSYELNLQEAYKFIVENDDTYSFEIAIKDNDKVQSYYPIYIFENNTIHNDLKKYNKFCKFN